MASRQKLQAYCKTLLGFRAGLCFHPCHPPGAQQGPVARLCACWNTWRNPPRSATKPPCSSRSAPKSRPPRRRHPPHGAALPLARRPSRRAARSFQRRSGVLPGRAGIQRPLAQCARSSSSTSSASSKSCAASRMPADMEFMDIRKGSDAEFGQSIYEPFGIAQVEPISFGGICVFTNVCGCAASSIRPTDGRPTPNVIVADYTDLPEQIASRPSSSWPSASRSATKSSMPLPESSPAGIGRPPAAHPAEFEHFIERGYALASRMSWDVVAKQYVLPGIARAARAQRLKQIA